MGFFKKRGKQTVAAAFIPKAPPTRPPTYGKARNTNTCTSDSSTVVTVSTKRNALVASPVSNFGETNHSNNMNGAALSVYDPDSAKQKEPIKTCSSFGSSKLAKNGIDGKSGLKIQGEGRSILPVSKDAPHQAREPTSTRHGQDSFSYNIVRDQGSVREDPPGHTAPSGKNERSGKKHLSVANKTIYMSGSNSQENDDKSLGDQQNNARKHYDIEEGGRKVSASEDVTESCSVGTASFSRASSGWFTCGGLEIGSHDDPSLEEYSIRSENHLIAHSNMQQTDHRDDESNCVGDRNANNSNSHAEESAEEYSNRDSLVDFVKNTYDHDDMSNHDTTTCWSCPFFQSNDDDGDDSAKEHKNTYTEAHESVTNKSFSNDGIDESINQNCSIGEESIDDGGSSDGGISSSCSISLDESTFHSDGDESTDTKKDDPPGCNLWFGYGQGGDEDNEETEDTSMTSSDEGTSMASSDDCTGFSEQPEKTMKDGKRLTNGGGIKVAKVEINGGSNALDPPQKLNNDSEGLLLSSSKPVRRVPSLVKSLKKLKGNGNSGEEKSVEGNRWFSLTPSDKSTGSTKVTRKAPMNEKVKICDKLTVDKRLWDADERQRDLFCAYHGGIESLSVRQYNDVPVPNAPDHVLVKVEASTVSTRDCIIRADDDTNTSFTPFVPGFQVVGQVCALGPEVNPFQIRVGDRVAALLPRGGGNAKYISTHSSLAIILPESVNHDDIICLVSNYMIAYQCLKLAKKDGAPLTNANVLITRASGPVGQALIELALQEGANVYSTAHKMHEEHLTKLGTKWFSVKPEKWLPVLEGKMDVVIDTMTIDGYESSYRALTDNGILICNVSDPSKLQRFSKSNDNPGLSIWWSTLKAKLFWSRAIFYELEESYQTNPRLFAQELNYLACKLQRGEIRPKVAGRVTLNQVPKAQQLIEKGLPNGTVVCLPWKRLDPNQKVKVEMRR